MAVAKSYAELEQLTEPYIVDGRSYIKVRMRNGNAKQVRWYTDKEYAKMYPEDEIRVDETSYLMKNQKDALGFTNGYITIFRGDEYEYLDWFHRSSARFAKPWDWYFISSEPLPDKLPAKLTPVRLTWEEVSDGETLKNETELARIINQKRYEPSDSNYVGVRGERLDLELTIKKAIPLDSSYGMSTLHIMEDADKNIFTWTTSAKQLVEGKTYKMRGTVVEHTLYKNQKQTKLNRCSIKED